MFGTETIAPDDLQAAFIKANPGGAVGGFDEPAHSLSQNAFSEVIFFF